MPLVCSASPPRSSQPSFGGFRVLAWGHDGFAERFPIPGLPDLLIQKLLPGEFVLTSTKPDGPDDPLVLLQGTTSGFSIRALEGSAIITYQAPVTYTGGVICDSLVAEGLGFAGWLEIDCIDIGSLQIGSNGYLAPFTANGSVAFYVTIPEPGSTSLLLLGGAMLLHRRRRRRDDALASVSSDACG